MMSDGYIDRAVDSLLDAVGDLDTISMGNVETLIDSAIAKVLAASGTGMSTYVAMLQKLKTDAGAVRAGIRKASHEIEELAVRIDNAEY
jgi:hypothetical protein